MCAGEPLEALPMGALYWPAERLLAVADLHLEKGSSYAVNARKLLPRYDTRQTLGALAALIDAVRPRTLVCLGDSFHDRAAIERMPETERMAIARLTSRTRFVWIAGNHDPRRRRRDGARWRGRLRPGPWCSGTRHCSGRPRARCRVTIIPWPRSRCADEACGGAAS